MDFALSVIMPVYNCAGYVSRAIESIINQSCFEQIQLILVDDGSKDNSGKICDDYAKEHSNNIKVIHQQNSGVSAARNNGLKCAEGEWIAFLDSDDYYLDGSLALMLKNADSDLVCGNYTINGSKSVLTNVFKKDKFVKDEFDEFLYPLMSSGHDLYTCWAKLFRHDIIKKHNIEFDPTKKYAEDMMFVYTYIRHAQSFRFINDDVYYYYVNENSATTNVKDSFSVYKHIYEWLANYFENENILPSLQKDFIIRSVGSMWVACANVSAKDAEQAVQKILSDSTFSELYKPEMFSPNSATEMNIKVQIEKKNAKGIVKIIKKQQLREKIYKLIKGANS